MASRSRTARGTTFGGFAFASLLLIVASGIGLALPFDAHRPYDSVALLLLTSPGARFYRNLHYFAAQTFIVLTVLHTWDHFRRSTERRLSVAVWARVTLTLPLAAFLMLSGFILKGDAESMQALRIVSTVIGQIPFIGLAVSLALFGSPSGDMQVLYLHHVATATVLVWLIVAEHARRIWPKAVPVASLFVVTGGLALFVSPTLHDGLDPLVRGPWYFLGVQELLHWTARPGWVIALGALALCAFLWLPRLSQDHARRVKVALAVSLIGYAAVTVFALLFRGENWSLVPPLPARAPGLRFEPALGGPSIEALRGRDIPIVLGRREGCLYCHRNARGLSSSHRADAVGCASCHAGNPFSLDPRTAHSGMILISGNLSTAARACGLPQCHADAVGRVHRSVMTTMSGVVSVDRAMLGRANADTHVRQLCASCHLTNAKRELGPIIESSRGGGCAACHLNYSLEARAALIEYENHKRRKNDDLPPAIHPDISIEIGNGHCFGCHSRSGRISTNYEGWMEVAPNSPRAGRGFSPAKLRTLADGRVFEFISPDVHFEKGMRCVDCHTAREVMGDGIAHSRKSGQMKIACEDCHVSGEPRRLAAAAVDSESRRILAVRERRDSSGQRVSQGPFLPAANGGEPLLNTIVGPEGARLVAKQSGTALDLKRPPQGCMPAGAHSRLSCVSCHSAWAPRCTGCHTRFDGRRTGYDHVAGSEVTGAWLEEAGDFRAAPPALGVRTVREPDGRTRDTVETFVPGMVLTFAPDPRASDTVFRRLYARAFSHTVSKSSRSCGSCHDDPVALGWGTGTLTYERFSAGGRGSAASQGRWVFRPEHEVSGYDRLPTDAWIGFLEDLPRAISRSSRSDVRPFTSDEQKRILTVGACLTCHEGNSPTMRAALRDFKAVLGRATARCVLPVWP